jgi:hypothetical protein
MPQSARMMEKMRLTWEKSGTWTVGRRSIQISQRAASATGLEDLGPGAIFIRAGLRR